MPFNKVADNDVVYVQVLENKISGCVANKTIIKVNIWFKLKLYKIISNGSHYPVCVPFSFDIHYSLKTIWGCLRQFKSWVFPISFFQACLRMPVSLINLGFSVSLSLLAGKYTHFNKIIGYYFNIFYYTSIAGTRNIQFPLTNHFP